MKKLLISGGQGKLATCIQKYNTEYNIIAPSKLEMDITKIDQIENFVLNNKPDIFLHAAALTRPMIRHVNKPDISIKTNIIGTANVVLMCMKYNIKLIYISTDHVYPGTRGNYKEEDPLLPFNKYGWSKLGGECAVKLYDNSLILRMCICDKPFPHDKAFIDVKRSYIYNDDASKITLKLLKNFGIINIGGKPQSVYNFVKKTNKKIKKILLKDISDVILGKNTTLNINKLKNFKLIDNKARHRKTDKTII